MAAAVNRIQRQRSDYEAVERLTQDGDLRAQALLRLAELDTLAGDFKGARQRLQAALQAGPASETERHILLQLGDIFERRLSDRTAAVEAYRRLVLEHPGTAEAGLAELRLKEARHAD